MGTLYHLFRASIHLPIRLTNVNWTIVANGDFMVHWFPSFVVTKCYKLCDFSQQNYVLWVFKSRRPTLMYKEGQPTTNTRMFSSPAFPSFWQWPGFIYLQMQQANICLSCHTAFLLYASVFHFPLLLDTDDIKVTPIRGKFILAWLHSQKPYFQSVLFQMLRKRLRQILLKIKCNP